MIDGFLEVNSAGFYRGMVKSWNRGRMLLNSYWNSFKYSKTFLAIPECIDERTVIYLYHGKRKDLRWGSKAELLKMEIERPVRLRVSRVWRLSREAKLNS